MRKFIYILFIVSSNVFATNYYFDPISGSDGNSGTSTGSPKENIENFDASVLSAGDTVFLSDTVHYQSANWNNINGSLGSDIVVTTYNIYGSNNAKLKGLKDVSGTFTDAAGDIWTLYDADIPNELKKTIYSPTFSYFAMFMNGLYINGSHNIVGQEPEGIGVYYETDSWYSTGTTGWYLQEDDNTWSNGYWNGGFIECMVLQWEIFQLGISSYSGNKFYTDYSTTNASERNGFNDDVKFKVINHVNACDNDGEWSTTNNTISVYYTGNLNTQTVLIPDVDSVFQLNNCSYIKLENIDFFGGNVFQIIITDANDIDVQSCNFYESPYAAIAALNSDDLDFSYNEIYDGQSIGIYTRNCGDKIISHNIIKRCGINHGYGYDTNGEHGHGIADYLRDGETNITYNNIDSTGGSGIYVVHNKDDVDAVHEEYLYKNIIQSPLILLGDLGGIYTYGDDEDVSKIIRKNILINSRKNTAMMREGLSNSQGIYNDEESRYFLVDSNYVYNAHSGIYQNPPNTYNIYRNNLLTRFDEENSSVLQDGFRLRDLGSGSDNTTFTRNKVVMQDANSAGMTYQYSLPFTPEGSYCDSNDYYNPFDATDSPIRDRVFPSNATVTLPTWRTTTSNAWAVNSTMNSTNWYFTDVSGITADEMVHFFSNWSNTSHWFPIGTCVLKDLEGSNNSDSIQIEAYSSEAYLYVSGDVDDIEYYTFIQGEIPTPPTPTPDDTLIVDTVLVKIANSRLSYTLPPTGYDEWNNANNYAQGTIQSLDKPDGSDSDLRLYIDSSGISFNATGNTSGSIFPDSVALWAHRADGENKTESIRGVTPGHMYKLSFFSSSTLEVGSTYFKVGTDSVTINHYDNSDDTVSIYYLPTDTVISINWGSVSGFYGFMNAIILSEVDTVYPDCPGEAVISNYNNYYTYICNVDSIPGNLTYQWYVNDITSGLDQNTYSTFDSEIGDKINCIVSSSTCGDYTSNNLYFRYGTINEGANIIFIWP